jgi:hypothetical protein
MKHVFFIAISFLLFSCNSSDSAPGNDGGGGGTVVNLEEINKSRQKLLNSWETWTPQSRNQKDIVTHSAGEVVESVGDTGSNCHYIFNGVTYTTVWNREADTYDIEREFSGLLLGSETTEEEEVCFLRANSSNLGDSLGLAILPMAFLYMDQAPRDGSVDIPFDEIKPVRFDQSVVKGLKIWTITYFLRGTMEDFGMMNLKELNSLKSTGSFSGHITFTFASEVPFTAWLLKTGYDLKLSNGSVVAGEEKQVVSINGSFIQ